MEVFFSRAAVALPLLSASFTLLGDQERGVVAAGALAMVVDLQSSDCSLRHHPPLQQPFPTGTHLPRHRRADDARNDLL